MDPTQRCENVPTCQQCWCKKNLISGKIFAIFASLRFFLAFLAHLGTLCYFLAFFCTIRIFLALYTVLLQITFVIIYALFLGKTFFGSNHLVVKKNVFSHFCPPLPSNRATPTFLWGNPYPHK